MRSTLTILTVALCAFLAAPVQAADTAAATPSQADMEAMMTAYMEAATPGPEHARLAELAGTYACTTQMRMNPTDDFMSMTGTETIEPILGGRFIQMHVIGAPDAMMPDGFEAMAIMGYNITEQRYEESWVDSMGTLMLFTTGTADADGNITLEGSYNCPYLKKPIHQRYVWSMTDTGYEIAMYGPDMSGTEFHMGTVTAVRQ
ncbi:MAG: DUF1579 family protein [bacterium]